MSRLRKSWLFLLAFALLHASCSRQTNDQPQAPSMIVFEGARLIVGDGSAAIENSAFVVQNNQFTVVGPLAAVQIPAGAARVDLSGKTVMPAMVDLHGHFGFQNVAAGAMSKEDYTRENLISHLERLAYHGVSTAIGVGDLVSRSDLKDGRTNWGDVPLRVQGETNPNAALFRTTGTGIAWPGSGPQGHPSRRDIPYPVTTVEEARAAVQDNLLVRPDFIKIWVDTRGGTMRTLTPPLYRAVIEEAHKHNVPVAVHNARLADAKGLFRAGAEGWLHTPVRDGEAVDEELLAIVRDRVANNNRPKMWMSPAPLSFWMDIYGGQRPAWLEDPLLRETYAPDQIEEHWGRPLANMTPEQLARAKREFELQKENTAKLRAAGVRLVTGSDTGQTRFWIGYFQHLYLECFVAMGLTPGEAIVAATRDPAEIIGLNTGTVAPGKSADFIVLDANPLENIANTRRINRVYLRGQEVDRPALRAKWQARQARGSSQSR
jgi:imidazolonepropionase-like amidohydrolase